MAAPCLIALFLPLLAQASPGRFVVDTLPVVRHCEFGADPIGYPHLRARDDSDAEAVEAAETVNRGVRERFAIESESDTQECWGWTEVAFESRIVEGILWIDWNGCYLGPYESCYTESLVFDLGDGGRRIETLDFDHARFLRPGALRKLDPAWPSDCRSAFQEARECSGGVDPYCSCEEPVLLLTDSSLVVKLSDDCYPHVCQGCSPTLSREIPLRTLRRHLSPLGRRILLNTAYLRSDPLGRYLIYRKEKDPKAGG